jgi:hypothetical protein
MARLGQSVVDGALLNDSLQTRRSWTANDDGSYTAALMGPMRCGVCASVHSNTKRNPAAQIANFALQKRADMIAMTLHGKSHALPHAFGGTAERLLRIAPCPLLVVK